MITAGLSRALVAGLAAALVASCASQRPRPAPVAPKHTAPPAPPWWQQVAQHHHIELSEVRLAAPASPPLRASRRPPPDIVAVLPASGPPVWLPGIHGPGPSPTPPQPVADPAAWLARRCHGAPRPPKVAILADRRASALAVRRIVRTVRRAGCAEAELVGIGRGQASRPVRWALGLGPICPPALRTPPPPPEAEGETRDERPHRAASAPAVEFGRCRDEATAVAAEIDGAIARCLARDVALNPMLRGEEDLVRWGVLFDGHGEVMGLYADTRFGALTRDRCIYDAIRAQAGPRGPCLIAGAVAFAAGSPSSRRLAELPTPPAVAVASPVHRVVLRWADPGAWIELGSLPPKGTKCPPADAALPFYVASTDAEALEGWVRAWLAPVGLDVQEFHVAVPATVSVDSLWQWAQAFGAGRSADWPRLVIEPLEDSR